MRDRWMFIAFCTGDQSVAEREKAIDCEYRYDECCWKSFGSPFITAPPRMLRRGKGYRLWITQVDVVGNRSGHVLTLFDTLQKDYPANSKYVCPSKRKCS